MEWEEGCYNGDIKKRKKSYEAAQYKYALQRSNQLRKLYLCMLEGDSNTTISTTHDVDDYGDDEEHNCNSTTSMMLSPDDLSDEEWYYIVSMSYVFSPSQWFVLSHLLLNIKLIYINSSFSNYSYRKSTNLGMKVN